MRLLLIAALLAAPAAHAQMAAETVNNPAAGVSVTPGGLAAVNPENSVLFANGTFVSQPTGGGPAGTDPVSVLTAPDTTLGAGCVTGDAAVGFRVADNFTVPTGGWTIQQINVFGYQTQAAPGGSTTSPFTGGTLRIWNGPPNVAGSTVVFGDTTTNRLGSTGWSGAWRVTNTTLNNLLRPIMRASLTVNQLLQPGTYWVDYSLTVPTGAAFCPPNTTAAATNNALQFSVATSTWAALADGGSLRPLDLPFEVVGTAAAAPITSVPAAGTAITLTGGTGSIVFTNPGAATTLTCTAPAGFTATPSPLNLAANGTGTVTLGIAPGTLPGTITGTLSCQAQSGGAPLTFPLTATVQAQPPVVSTPVNTLSGYGLGLLALLLAGLGVAGVRRYS